MSPFRPSYRPTPEELDRPLHYGSALVAKVIEEM